MRIEVPQFTKCCCCIPLRYGLLIWGYIKVLLALFSLAVVTVVGIHIITRFFTYDVILIWATLIFIALLDLGIHIVFVVGAHMKSYKLLRVYYYATLVGLIVYVLLFIGYFCTQIVVFCNRPESRRNFDQQTIVYLIEEVSLVIVNIGLQSYLLMLTRSEILKLQANCRFMFVNNAAEAECKMQDKEYQEKPPEYNYA